MKVYKYVMLIFMHISNIVFSQILIGESRINGSAMLDINTNDKVLILPKVELNDLYNNMSPIDNVQEGSIVYNTKVNVSDASTENFVKGVYSWNGEQWVYFGQMEKLTVYKNITSTDR